METSGDAQRSNLEPRAGGGREPVVAGLHSQMLPTSGPRAPGTIPGETARKEGNALWSPITPSYLRGKPPHS